MVERDVAAHYGRGDLATTLLRALRAAGLDAGPIRPEQLARVDEFHMRGRDATTELVTAMALGPEQHVLDVGCGLGGPTRHVAAEVGCPATGVDLVREYVEVARDLTARCGLARTVHFEEGNAYDLPFADGSFDAALTQHACMNIPDKARVYAEVRRVVRAGAPFGVYDAMQGPGGDVAYPVPWAEDASISFLSTPDETCRTLREAGFRVESVEDRTQECLAWLQGMRARAEAGAPALGFHLLLGARFARMAETLVRNLSERRVVGVQVVARAR